MYIQRMTDSSTDRKREEEEKGGGGEGRERKREQKTNNALVVTRGRRTVQGRFLQEAFLKSIIDTAEKKTEIEREKKRGIAWRMSGMCRKERDVGNLLLFLRPISMQHFLGSRSSACGRGEEEFSF